MSQTSWLIIAIVLGVISVGVAVWLYFWVMRQDPGSERAREVASWIRTGSTTYLRRLYLALTLVAIGLGIIIAIVFSFDIANLGLGDIEILPGRGITMALSFLTGAICSAVAGYMGMSVAVAANVRSATAAEHGINKAFRVAFYAGAVMGLAMVGMAAVGMSTVFLVTGSVGREEVFWWDRSKLAAGVEDLSISRAKEKLGGWGIEMPNDPTHSVYVWIDALSNYYTALGRPAIGDEYDDAGAKYWPATVHLIGKDILWFHAVYWPCMLMALDVPLPRTVFAHGWWTSNGKKMSKSLGNFVSREQIAEICTEYSVDVYRWFLMRAVTFGGDGDFSAQTLRTKYNTELANGVGNLLSRTVNMIGRYFEGTVPPAGEVGPDEQEVIASAQRLVSGAEQAMRNYQFHVLLDDVVSLVDATNRYIDQTAPFKLAKDPSQRSRLATIMATCAQAVCIALAQLEPIMPTTARLGLEQLGVDGPAPAESAAWGERLKGSIVKKGEGLFPRKQ